MTDHIIDVLDHVVSNSPPHACACMGPQDDEPLCPCAMNSVVLYKGRWVRMELLPLEDADEDWAVTFCDNVDSTLLRLGRYDREKYWSEKAINERVTKMDPKRLP